MNRTNDNILDHDDDALLSEKHIRPFEFFKNLSESYSIRFCLVTIRFDFFYVSLSSTEEEKDGEEEKGYNLFSRYIFRYVSSFQGWDTSLDEFEWSSRLNRGG